MRIQIFREQYFCHREFNHEIHENIVPRKFGAIQYYMTIILYIMQCHVTSHAQNQRTSAILVYSMDILVKAII